MDTRTCYVFESPRQRPAKRQKTNASTGVLAFGQRRIIYERLWARQEVRIHALLHSVNSDTLSKIISFVTTASRDQCGGKIPTALITQGPGSAAHQSLFEQLEGSLEGGAQSAFVALKSEEASNLKNLLKTLIQKATAHVEDDDAEEFGPRRRSGPKLLSYDLQLLHNWYIERDFDRVVIALEDSEAFSNQVLAEVIMLLKYVWYDSTQKERQPDGYSSWMGRVPFVLLFSVATSVDIFHDKLPRAALRCMQGEQFDVVQLDVVLEQIVDRLISDEEAALFIGPTLLGKLIDRQKDHVQSIELFIDAVKYAYMSHFYANVLSIFVNENLEIEQVLPEHFEALRNLPSFHRRVEDCLDRGEARRARNLLDANAKLFTYTKRAIRKGQTSIRGIIKAIKIFNSARACFPKKTPLPLSILYIQAMAEGFKDSTTIGDLLLSVKKSSSDVMLEVMGRVSSVCKELDVRLEGVKEISSSLASLLKDPSTTDSPLRSEHDLRNQSLRTTIVAQKVELDKQKSSLTANDAAYSKIASNFANALETYFQNAFVNPRSLFLHELFIYDLASPHRDVFTPKPRFAIERALSAPHDYLGCSCCDVPGEDKASEGTLSSTQPSTAILYQLYLESGAMINVFDLWSAFNAIIGSEKTEEKAVMAQFYHGLAELRNLGFIKPSRSRTDHIAKTAWKGL